MSYKGFFILAASLSTSICLISCVKKDVVTNTITCNGATEKSFVTDVNPIIQSYCNQPDCHNPGSINGPGSLTNYSEVYNAREAIKIQISAGLMPQNTTLTIAQRQSIVCWINSGAVNN